MNLSRPRGELTHVIVTIICRHPSQRLTTVGHPNIIRRRKCSPGACTSRRRKFSPGNLCENSLPFRRWRLPSKPFDRRRSNLGVAISEGKPGQRLRCTRDTDASEGLGTETANRVIPRTERGPYRFKDQR